MSLIDILSPEARLTTVIGPAGIGKSCLVMNLAWQLVRRYPDGVWWVDLAPVTGSHQVVSAAALALGVALRGSDPAEAIAEAICDKTMVLVFDGCDRVSAATAALIGILLARAPGLTVIATGRQGLKVAGERLYPMNPLGLPPRGAPGIAGYGAVMLFLDRVARVCPDFAVHDHNEAFIGGLCRILGGNPLALELASALVPVFGVGGLLAGLLERLPMARTSPLAAETHARILPILIGWSFGSLPAADQRVFVRLGVFSGDFSLEAASAVAAGRSPPDEIGRILRCLTDRFLIMADKSKPPRYRLLEPLRHYALDRLTESGCADADAGRHADYFSDWLDEAEDAWEQVSAQRWLDLYRRDIDNIRSALAWALADPARKSIAIALAGASASLWERLNLLTEGRSWLDRAVVAGGPDLSGRPGARLLRGAGRLWLAADRRRALASFEAAARLHHGLNDQLGLAPLLDAIGGLHAAEGRGAAAKAAFDEARAIFAAEAARAK